MWIFESEELLKRHSSESHTIMRVREDSKEASRSLYQDLRDCDQKEKIIFIFFNPKWHKIEEWRAFKNRLLKASTKWFSIHKK